MADNQKTATAVMTGDEMVEIRVPANLVEDVMYGLCERITYHVGGLTDDPLDEKSLQAINDLQALVKKINDVLPVDLEF